MEKSCLTEQAEYNARWASAESGKTTYSAKDIGYTPHFLRFMDAGLAGLVRPIRALEVGCGDGFFTGQLAERGCDATGIDLSPVGIASASRKSQRVGFRSMTSPTLCP